MFNKIFSLKIATLFTENILSPKIYSHMHAQMCLSSLMCFVFDYFSHNFRVKEQMKVVRF